MSAELTDELKAHFKASEAKRRAKKVEAWCDALGRTSSRFRPRLKGGFTAGVELQPLRWLAEGMAILRSANVLSRVQLMDGRQGESMQSILPYPVFLAGTELFLKGMWLCRFPACRRVARNSYVSEPFRRRINRQLRNQNHDLLKLISLLKRVARYRADPATLRFLHRVSTIVRQFYLPIDKANRAWSWAAARYPIRLYNDQARTGRANALQSFPDQRLVIDLFGPMERHLDELWQLRPGLL
jgi:hypothetical protein